MVLSGYVLMSKFFKTGNLENLELGAAKRYIRLVLPALVSVLFAWGLLTSGFMGNQLAGILDTAGWPIWFYTQPVGFAQALVNGLFTAPLFGDSSLNGPLWTLQLELLGSILLFASYSIFGRRSLLLMTFWFLFFVNVLAGGSKNTLYYVGLVSGSLLHVVTPWLKKNPFPAAGLVMIGLVGVMADHSPLYAPLMRLPVLNLQVFHFPNYNDDRVLFWQTVGAIFLVAGVIGAGWFARILSSQIPAYLGRISFAVYLLHMPLIMSLVFWGMLAGRNMGMDYLGSVLFSFSVFMVALVALAEIFTRYVDGPAIRFADSFARALKPRRPIQLADAAQENQLPTGAALMDQL